MILGNFGVAPYVYISISSTLRRNGETGYDPKITKYIEGKNYRLSYEKLRLHSIRSRLKRHFIRLWCIRSRVCTTRMTDFDGPGSLYGPFKWPE